jgi:hypothetical protein
MGIKKSLNKSSTIGGVKKSGSGVCTELSVKDIQALLAEYFGIRNNIIVPNVSWGLLDYEADLLIMNKTGYVTEIEIKRSWSDFLADFKKDDVAHKSELIYQFWYCVPDALYSKCIEKLKEVYPDSLDRPNVISYSDSGILNFHGKSASYCRGKHRKLFLEEQLKLTRLGCMRYWSSEFKRIRTEQELEIERDDISKENLEIL